MAKNRGGRPPIGAKAMSNAQRQRRYRERLKLRKAVAEKSATAKRKAARR